MKHTKKLLSLFVIVFLSYVSNAQSSFIEPVGVGETMGSFALKTYQGGEVDLNNLKGKNVLLVFPRGRVLSNLWCPICYYQYAELAESDKLNKLVKNGELEVFYVMPYPKDTIDSWYGSVNGGLAAVESWKHPKDYETLTSENPAKRWADYAREFFPQTFTYEEGKMPLPIPILLDADKVISKALVLNTEEWGGTKTNQNMPTVFLLDKNGVIKFKYHSQYTNDRPTIDYILEYYSKMM